VQTDITTLGRVVDHVVASGSKTDNFKSVFQSLMVVTSWARTKKWVAAECFGGPVEVKMLFKNGCMRTSTQSTTNEDDETSISMADVPTWEDVVRLSNEVGDITGGRASSQLIGQKYAAAVRVAAGTGLRLCELLAVTAGRVSLKAGFITVDRQLDRYKVWVPGTPMPTAPTKNRSTRKARIWSSVQADLEFLMDGLEPDDPLVGPYNGISWWADAWGNLLTEAGERCNWTWSGHYLRHHYGSFSTAPVEQGGKGMSYAAVMKSMGHKTLKTTIETYIHDVSRDDEGWID
jgi:integrase